MMVLLAMITSIYHYFENSNSQRILLMGHVMNPTMGIVLKMKKVTSLIIVQFDFKLVGFHT